MKKQKQYEVNIELDRVTVKVKASSKKEAKDIALNKLSKMNPTKLIYSYRDPFTSKLIKRIDIEITN